MTKTFLSLVGFLTLDLTNFFNSFIFFASNIGFFYKINGIYLNQY